MLEKNESENLTELKERLEKVEQELVALKSKMPKKDDCLFWEIEQDERLARKQRVIDQARERVTFGLIGYGCSGDDSELYDAEIKRSLIKAGFEPRY